MISITVPEQEEIEDLDEVEHQRLRALRRDIAARDVRVITNTVSTRPYANSAAAPASDPSTGQAP